MDTSDDEVIEEPEYDEEDQYSTKSHLPTFVMRDCLLKDFISDPHQHIIYEYDFMNPKVFYIELQKALKTDDADGFPRCTYKKMELPVQLSVSDVPDPEDLDLDLDEEQEEDSLFGDGFDEEDFSSLNEFSDFS